VLEERIIFLNLIASPEGLNNICNRFKKVKVISAWVDQKLDEQKYIRMRLALILEQQCGS
jgi:uracil phosphoribosyltransferase